MQLERLYGADGQQHSSESLPVNKNGIARLAEEYIRLLGLNPTEIFSNTVKSEFWDPEYMDKGGINLGMAVMDSLRCLVDFERTYSLLAGIQKTVDCMKTEGHSDIVGIDAGTGSGILAMGLVAAGCSKVYALEINPATVNLSRKFIERCGFSDKIEVIECDATRVDIAGMKDVDILVSENLANGLFDEPQYQIIKNLSPHLAPDAKIIPFHCTLYAALGWANWEGVGEEKFTIAANKLQDRIKASTQHAYMDVTSRRGMEIPRINGTTEIPVDSSRPINTLYISTRFQMNDGDNPIVLDPDAAEFLGRTSAFHLPSVMQVSGDVVNFRADYSVGFPEKLATIRVDNNLVTLESPNT